MQRLTSVQHMSFSVFSTNSVTDSEGRLIADAYFRSSKNVKKMKEILDVGEFDLGLLTHPLVKKYIVEKQLALAESYSLTEHLAKLKEIRNGAMDDENWKVALTAEVAVGKAAGLYENMSREDPIDNSKAEQLSTEELRKRLANMGRALPAPTDFEDMDFQPLIGEDLSDSLDDSI